MIHIYILINKTETKPTNNNNNKKIPTNINEVRNQYVDKLTCEEQRNYAKPRDELQGLS